VRKKHFTIPIGGNLVLQQYFGLSEKASATYKSGLSEGVREVWLGVHAWIRGQGVA
jgi:hypothetical protein